MLTRGLRLVLSACLQIFLPWVLAYMIAYFFQARILGLLLYAKKLYFHRMKEWRILITPHPCSAPPLPPRSPAVVCCCCCCKHVIRAAAVGLPAHSPPAPFFAAAPCRVALAAVLWASSPTCDPTYGSLSLRTRTGGRGGLAGSGTRGHLPPLLPRLLHAATNHARLPWP